jgi:hypothetical protein
MTILESLPDAIVVANPTEPSRPADLASLAKDLGSRYGELRQAAEMYADHQKLRIVTGNRVDSLTVDVADYEPYKLAMEKQEEVLSRQLVRLYRATVPAGVLEWQASTAGVGEHMLARLLGHLGHPRLTTPKHWARNTTIADGEWGNAENPKRMLVDGEPFLRSFSQLRQFCGHGAPVRRRAGMSQEEAFALGNPGCKMLVHLIAGSVVKAQVRRNGDERYATGALGGFYLTTKATYRERSHTGPCSGGYTTAGKRVVFAKCKVDGHYAVAGDPYSPSHVNAIALRHLGKQILTELFHAAWEEWCQ